MPQDQLPFFGSLDLSGFPNSPKGLAHDLPLPADSEQREEVIEITAQILLFTNMGCRDVAGDDQVANDRLVSTLLIPNRIRCRYIVEELLDWHTYVRASDAPIHVSRLVKYGAQNTYIGTPKTRVVPLKHCRNGNAIRGSAVTGEIMSCGGHYALSCAAISLQNQVS
jgi:hypothetical protein